MTTAATRYAALDADIERAFTTYAADVRQRRFPERCHVYPLDGAVEAEIVAEGQLPDAASPPCASTRTATSFMEV